MAERHDPYQLSFEDIPQPVAEPADASAQHEEGATHTVLTGSRIKVKSKHHSYYSWATAATDFDVAEQEKNEEPYHERAMRFCLAMQAFSVFYPQHGTTIPYDTGHPLFIFPPSRENTQVVRIPKRRVAKK